MFNCCFVVLTCVVVLVFACLFVCYLVFGLVVCWLLVVYYALRLGLNVGYVLFCVLLDCLIVLAGYFA